MLRTMSLSEAFQWYESIPMPTDGSLGILRVLDFRDCRPLVVGAGDYDETLRLRCARLHRFSRCNNWLDDN